MASVLSKLMTAEEFYDWSQAWDNRDRNFELECGVVVEIPLSGERKGFVCGNLCGLFGSYLHARRAGYVCSNNVGLIVERNPDTVLGPDIAVFLDRRKYDELETGCCKHMPRLAVDILPDVQRPAKIQKRVNRFLNNGFAMVWLIDIEDRIAIVNLPDKLPRVFEGDEEMTGFGVLPDFRCSVSDFFVMAGEEI
jgi:Uma2 family endonuclease